MFNVDDFKARLLSARKEAYNTKTQKKGYSQEEAAELLIGEGGKRSTVAAWENPKWKNLPSIDILLKLAVLYDVDVRYLLDGENEVPNAGDETIATTLNLSVDNVVTLKNNPKYGDVVNKIIGKELFEQIVNKINNLALSSILKDVILTSFTATFSKKLSKMFDSYYFQELTISINQSGFLDFIKKNIPYNEKSFDADEFLEKKGQTVFVSATPADFEKKRSTQIVEQIIRPTGLLDPEVEVRPIKGQIDDLLGEINERVARHERVLVTTLTKKMAEDLSEYLENHKVKCRYMHHGTETIERMELLRDLRMGEFDVLVGINLLREGLDLPEVSLVAILDADKEGFLRSEASLIQTIGRAARNAGGKVIMYADNITGSMDRAIKETNRRRKIQNEYNIAHGITPKTIVKEISMPLAITASEEMKEVNSGKLSAAEKKSLIEKLTADMKKAAKELDFESAAVIRDKIKKLL